MRYALIVFDWDGTLLDSTAAIGECIRHAARELGLPRSTLVSRLEALGLTGKGVV